MIKQIKINLFREATAMIDKKALCDKIQQMYPEIGECGIDLTVNYNRQQNAWAVDLKKDNHELKHFLENPDAEACMAGKQCVSLGLEIAQLVKNIKGEQF
jgi:hypothetical protein